MKPTHLGPGRLDTILVQQQTLLPWYNACHIFCTVAGKTDDNREIGISLGLVCLRHSCQHVREEGGANVCVDDAC